MDGVIDDGDGDGWSSLSRSSLDGGFDGGLGCSTMAMAGLLSRDPSQTMGLMVVWGAW